MGLVRRRHASTILDPAEVEFADDRGAGPRRGCRTGASCRAWAKEPVALQNLLAPTARPRRQARRVVAGRTVGELSCLEHGFDIRELGHMSTRTIVNTTTTAATSTTTTPAPGPRPKPARISVAQQVKQQRRGYATAVLRTLARTHQGRPATQIHATLRSSLAPLGVRLNPATLRELATDIAAGRPVELP